MSPEDAPTNSNTSRDGTKSGQLFLSCIAAEIEAEMKVRNSLLSVLLHE